RPPRLGGPEDGDPVRPLPRTGLGRRALRRRRAPARVSRPARLAVPPQAGRRGCRYPIRGMDENRPAKLRTVSETEEGAQPESATLQPAFDVNPLAELVADVIEATGLLAADKIAFVRERSRTGSFAQ